MRLLRPLLLLLSLAVFAPHAFAGGIDLNTADAAALESLPGIGGSKAAAIIQYRTDHGGFKSVDELDNVSGIGPSTLASVRDLVSVSAGGTAAAAAPAAAATSSAATSSAATSSAATTSAPASTSAGCPVNINKADAAALQNLPGIGESKAAAIVQYRTDHGAFASCNGLDDVSGIGPSTLATLAPCCSVQ